MNSSTQRAQRFTDDPTTLAGSRENTEMLARQNLVDTATPETEKPEKREDNSFLNVTD